MRTGCVLDESQAAELLVRRCVAGDDSAWEELVRRYQRKIYAICFRFTGSADAAEDLTQDVFVRMYRTLGTYQAQRASFMTWVATITRNLLVDHFRKSRPERLTESLEAAPTGNADALPLSEQIPDKAVGPDGRMHSREVRELIHAALQKLSPELREAVILRDLHDMDYREIAAAIRIPEGTVKSRINRGRTELARLLSRMQGQGM